MDVQTGSDQKQPDPVPEPCKKGPTYFLKKTLINVEILLNSYISVFVMPIMSLPIWLMVIMQMNLENFLIIN